MSYRIGWYIPGRVLYVRHPEHISVELITEINRAIRDYLDTASQPVHLISDARGVKTVPLNLLELRHKFTMLSHGRLGWMLTVTPNAMTRFFGLALPQLMGRQQYGVVASIMEAKAFLREHDETLDWSAADEGVFALETEMQ